MTDEHVHTIDEMRRGIEIIREVEHDVFHGELIRYCEQLLAENERLGVTVTMHAGNNLALRIEHRKKITLFREKARAVVDECRDDSGAFMQSPSLGSLCTLSDFIDDIAVGTTPDGMTYSENKWTCHKCGRFERVTTIGDADLCRECTTDTISRMTEIEGGEE